MVYLHLADTSDKTALSTARHFQLTAVFLAVVSFALLWAQSDEFWNDVIAIGSAYWNLILSFALVMMMLHFLTIRYLAFRKGATTQESLTWYKAYFNPARTGDLVFGAISPVIVLACFTAYKAKVVGSSGYAYDMLFIGWDRLIFAGSDAWEVTHGLLPDPVFTKVIDFLYHPTFPALLIGYLICLVAHAKPALRYTYMLSYLASFVLIGMVMAYSLSSAGPIFDGTVFGDGRTFGPLQDRLDAQNEIAGPFVFVFGKLYLLNLYEAGRSDLAGGISAMPSMHVVLASLAALAALHINRIAGSLLTIYAIIIWIGSVHLGWHYFVDGLVGLIALSIIWLLFGRMMGLYGPQVIRATT